MTYEPPRRIRRDRMIPAELAIVAAMEAVEALPADTRLTDAVELLQQARNRVADYVDGVNPIPNQDPAHWLTAPIAEVNAELRRIGLDPAEVGAEGERVAREALAKRRDRT